MLWCPFDLLPRCHEIIGHCTGKRDTPHTIGLLRGVISDDDRAAAIVTGPQDILRVFDQTVGAALRTSLTRYTLSRHRKPPFPDNSGSPASRTQVPRSTRVHPHRCLTQTADP